MRAAIHRASWSRTMKQAAVSSMVGEKRRSGMFPYRPQRRWMISSIRYPQAKMHQLWA